MGAAIFGKPERIASALDIMIEGPIGAAVIQQRVRPPGHLRLFPHVRAARRRAMARKRVRGYHKPIMIAGGMGNVRRQHVEKGEVPVGAKLVVLGGPAMLIGLGGGAASSMGSGASSADLDFASVQRGNPEIQRRAQEVIDRCWALGDENPDRADSRRGRGRLVERGARSRRAQQARRAHRSARDPERRARHVAAWRSGATRRRSATCSPSTPIGSTTFAAIAERERCPFAVIGEIDDSGPARSCDDPLFDNDPVDMPLEVLLGKPPRMTRDVRSVDAAAQRIRLSTGIDLREAAYRVLRFPAVADKTFLITIGDRTVGGLISRDQMVGPWQVPVSDVAVTLADYYGHAGEAMAMGERTPVAVLDAPASGRLAVGEAITNILAADIASLGRRAAVGQLDGGLRRARRRRGAVRDGAAVGEELCPALGIAIPVGKDSLSMKTRVERGRRRARASSRRCR